MMTVCSSNKRHLLAKLATQQELTNLLANNVLLGACDAAGAHIRATASHGFEPTGFSSAALLAESHATIHTWPETGEVDVDYFSCSEKPCFDEFIEYFVSKGFEVLTKQILER